MSKLKTIVSIFAVLLSIILGEASAQVKIGSNPGTINSSSILEIEDTSRGVLIPRMTNSQRDAISSPPDGLQLYNTSTSTIDLFQDSSWVSTKYENPKDNLVYVYSIHDLPEPSSGEIKLDSSKMYVFSGIIDISPNYLNLNGAALRGFDPTTDGIMSNVGGAVLRSTDQSVYIEDFATIPASASTQAYQFSDASGSKLCNLLDGNIVKEAGISSLGVGEIDGFKAIAITDNYWDCADGVKIGGNVGIFASVSTLILNISSGAGIEFESDLTINDIDLSNNYFIDGGQTGVKVNPGATIDRGRMTANIFRGLGTILDGFNSYTTGWYMAQNTNIPDSRAYGYIYMNGSNSSTNTSPNETYVKINGSTTSGTLQKFSSPTSNRLKYIGKEDITAKIFVSITAFAPANDSEFAIAIAKNGTAISSPNQASGTLDNNQRFSVILETEVDMVTDDYIEVFIKTTTSDDPINVTGMQFRAVN